MKSLQLKKHKNSVNQCSSVSDMGSVNPCLTLFSVSFAPKITNYCNFSQLYPLNYNPFMQNKANFKIDQMAATPFVVSNYEENRPPRRPKNKAKQSQFKANFKNAKNERNLIYSKGLRQKMALPAKKNKANSNPIQTQFQTCGGWMGCVVLGTWRMNRQGNYNQIRVRVRQIRLNAYNNRCQKQRCRPRKASCYIPPGCCNSFSAKHLRHKDPPGRLKREK